MTLHQSDLIPAERSRGWSFLSGVPGQARRRHHCGARQARLQAQRGHRSMALHLHYSTLSRDHWRVTSSCSALSDVSAEAVGVAVSAPPTDGEANTELIRFLAEVLDLKKSHVSLNKVCSNRTPPAPPSSLIHDNDAAPSVTRQGSRSRDKVIHVDSPLSPEEVLRRLREAAG